MVTEIGQAHEHPEPPTSESSGPRPN
jgi:hypothetical protein